MAHRPTGSPGNPTYDYETVLFLIDLMSQLSQTDLVRAMHYAYTVHITLLGVVAGRGNQHKFPDLIRDSDAFYRDLMKSVETYALEHLPPVSTTPM